MKCHTGKVDLRIRRHPFEINIIEGQVRRGMVVQLLSTILRDSKNDQVEMNWKMHGC